MCALALVVVAGGAGAIGARTFSTGIVAVRTLAGCAFVVVTIVLAVRMSVVNVVHVILMHNGLVPAVGAVGVTVGFSGSVCESGHDRSPWCV